MQDGCFSIGHWLFASRYYKISKEMPIIVRGKDVPEEVEAAHKRRYVVLLLLNYLAALIELTAFYIFNRDVFIKQLLDEEIADAVDNFVLAGYCIECSM